MLLPQTQIHEATNFSQMPVVISVLTLYFIHHLSFMVKEIKIRLNLKMNHYICMKHKERRAQWHEQLPLNTSAWIQSPALGSQRHWVIACSHSSTRGFPLGSLTLNSVSRPRTHPWVLLPPLYLILHPYFQFAFCTCTQLEIYKYSINHSLKIINFLIHQKKQ